MTRRVTAGLSLDTFFFGNGYRSIYLNLLPQFRHLPLPQRKTTSLTYRPWSFPHNPNSMHHLHNTRLPDCRRGNDGYFPWGCDYLWAHSKTSVSISTSLQRSNPIYLRPVHFYNDFVSCFRGWDSEGWGEWGEDRGNFWMWKIRWRTTRSSLSFGMVWQLLLINFWIGSMRITYSIFISQ